MKRRILSTLLTVVLLLTLISFPASAATRCVYCGGDGEVTCSSCGGTGAASGSVTGSCFSCHGSGYVTCGYCHGTGYLGADLGGDDEGGGGGGGGGGDPVAAARLSKTELTLVAGRSEKLAVTGTLAKVKWSSSNKAVATVNSKGKVVAKKAGKAVITAKVGSKKLKCKVTVKKKVYASSIKLDRKKASLIIGEGVQIGYTLKPKPEKITEKYSIKWSSDKKSVAVVDQNGNVTARGTGTATITARLKIKSGTFKKATCKVTVVTGRQRFVSWFNSHSEKVGGTRVWFVDANQSVVHDPAQGTWMFMKDEGYTRTSITFNETFTGSAKLYYYYRSRFGGSLEVEATATMPVSRVRRDAGYNWTFTSGDPTWHTSLAESGVTALLSAMQANLVASPRVGWYDLGLTSY